MITVKIVVLLAVASFAISKQQCYRMGLVSDNCDSTEVKVKVVKGSPGARGHVGARGPVGAPGINGKPCEASANLFKNLSAMLETKLGKMESSMETKFGKMESSIEGKLGKMESSMETKFGKMETKLGKMETKFGKMESSMEGKFGKIQKHLDDLDKHNKRIAKLEADLKKTKEVSKKSITVGQSCQKILANGKTRNGVYMITGAGTSFKAYCNMNRGGYMVFQRRFDGSTDFNQNFQTYVNGFGSLNGEHWLGLEKLHQFTKTGKHKLRVDLVAYDGATAYAIYEDFSIGVGPGYQLHIGKYSGTASDDLTYHNNMKFSTPERDNDTSNNSNCAKKSKGAFWYNQCHNVNLNAFNYHDKTVNKGMRWYHFKRGKPNKETTMMVL